MKCMFQQMRSAMHVPTNEKWNACSNKMRNGMHVPTNEIGMHVPTNEKCNACSNKWEMECIFQQMRNGMHVPTNEIGMHVPTNEKWDACSNKRRIIRKYACSMSCHVTLSMSCCDYVWILVEMRCIQSPYICCKQWTSILYMYILYYHCSVGSFEQLAELYVW